MTGQSNPRIGLTASLALTSALVALSWPVAWLHAATDKAGVVTALAGQAHVVRTSLAQPLPLKFKDDVLHRDKINTAEHSVVRVLLGGKALVTVRELSTLTITEETGRSTVDLHQGAVVAAVARKQMKPGEIIEIRTPNAVAAVRGTVLAVEVIPPQAGGQGQAVTNLHVLKGLVEVSAPGAPAAASVSVGAAQSVSVTGNALGQVRPTPPGVAAQLVQSVQTPHHHTASPAGASQQVIQTGHMQATALAQLLAPAPGQPQQGQPQGQPPQGSPQGQPQGSGPPLGPLLSGSPALSPMFGPQGPSGPGQFVRPFIVNTQNGPGPLVQTYIQTGTQDFSGSQPALSGSQSLRFFNGVTSLTNTGPLILFNNTTQTQSGGGGGGSGSLVQALAGSQTTLAGPLLQANNSTLSGSSNILAVLGTLSSSTGSGFVAFNQSTITVGGIVGVTVGSNLTLAGPLLTTLAGNLTLTNDILSVSGTLRSTAAAALVQFNGTTVNFSGSGTDVASILSGTLILNGPLLTMESGSPTVTIGGDILRAGPATITGPSGNPLVDVRSGTLSVRGDAFDLGPGTKLTLGGSLLFAGSGGLLVVDGTVVKSSPNSIVSTTSNAPLISLNGGTHSLANVANPDGVTIFALKGNATATEVADGVTLTLGTERPLQGAGATLTSPLVRLDGATLNTQQILKMDTALLEASEPLLALLGGASVTTGTDAITLTSKAKLATSSSVVNLNSGSMTVNSGSLLALNGGSLLSVNADLFNLQGGSKITIGSGFLINVSGGSVLVVDRALANFNSGSANTITVKNSSAPGFISGTYPFIRVLLVNGAAAGQLTLSGTLARNGGLANFSFPNGGSLIRLDGPNAKIVLKGN
nr:FecR domain-containing protein [Nitrospirota bacterium]